jgi:uncharacterized membrane protein YfcA
MDIGGAINPAYVASGFGVGLLVGLTGVGGGSLMTPLLVVLFGIRISTAVGTDLLFAAITKTVGVAAHGSAGTIDWRLTGRLAMGSLPAAALTILALYLSRKAGQPSSPLLAPILGGALIATAICLVARRWIERWVARRTDARPHHPLATVAVGAVLGVVVTGSSVGAGAIGMTALVLLYPHTPLARLVGSDIAHAVPLTLLAGLGYWLLGVIDWPLLGTLLIGSIPGILIGSRLAGHVPEAVLRPILATVLAVVGLRMLP